MDDGATRHLRSIFADVGSPVPLAGATSKEIYFSGISSAHLGIRNI
jgi:hypothetical protein